MVKKMYATTNFDESLLPMEKMRLILAGAKKAHIQAEPVPHIYFDDFFDNNAVGNNLKTFRSSLW